MTKKHFEAFARDIRDAGPEESNRLERATRIEQAWLIIRVAERDNSRFDREWFLRACGLE
jgi:hypothetical protein